MSQNIFENERIARRAHNRSVGYFFRRKKGEALRSLFGLRKRVREGFIDVDEMPNMDMDKKKKPKWRRSNSQDYDSAR